jgi:hypothetical protein
MSNAVTKGHNSKVSVPSPTREIDLLARALSSCSLGCLGWPDGLSEYQSLYMSPLSSASEKVRPRALRSCITILPQNQNRPSQRSSSTSQKENMRPVLTLPAIVCWLTAITALPSGATAQSGTGRHSSSYSTDSKPMLRSLQKVKEEKIKEEKEKKYKLPKEYIDWTRFGIALDLVKRPSSEGLILIVQSIEATVQEYVSLTWAGNSTGPVLIEPIVSTTGNNGQGNGRDRFLQDDKFKCKFSYCSVIGCNLCKRGRMRHLANKDTCFPRIKELEKAIDKNLKGVCKDDACSGGKVDVYAIQVLPGYELVELTTDQFCR